MLLLFEFLPQNDAVPFKNDSSPDLESLVYPPPSSGSVQSAARTRRSERFAFCRFFPSCFSEPVDPRVLQRQTASVTAGLHLCAAPV